MRNPMHTILFVLGMVSSFVSPIQLHAADSAATYTSPEIGSSAVVSFDRFIPLDQQTPSGTAIHYEFAGSATNFDQWSTGQSTDDSIDLSTIDKLRESQLMKVRIRFTSNGSETPSVKGFKVVYTTEKTVSTKSTNTTKSTPTDTASPTPTNSEPTPAEPPPSADDIPVVASEAPTTTTETTEIAVVTPAPKPTLLTRMGSGSSLVLYLALATFASIVTVRRFLHRRPIVEDIPNPLEPPSSPPPPTLPIS